MDSNQRSPTPPRPKSPRPKSPTPEPPTPKSPTPDSPTPPSTATPATSRRSSTIPPHNSLPSPLLLSAPSGPLLLTTRSANSWRAAYPRVGQFAVTASEDVVAASPDGLIFFKRVRDHDAKPWSEAQPFPDVGIVLNDSFVSGLAILAFGKRLNVYCVSGGRLHSIYQSRDSSSPFVLDRYSPLSTYLLVSGTPAVADHYNPRRWSLVVPCQSGGLLHTSTAGPLSYNSHSFEDSKWEPVQRVATDLGVISAVSITVTHGRSNFNSNHNELVAVCIVSAQLHVLDGIFNINESNTRYLKWAIKTSTKIHHPGKVTGNPVLVTKFGVNQSDLLVPSAEGGIFHFVRTMSTPNEWHMVARIMFPPGLPVASCLAFNIADNQQGRRQFSAIIQSEGRLYQVRTYEGADPWSGSHLKPIVVPGPFSD